MKPISQDHKTPLFSLDSGFWFWICVIFVLSVLFLHSTKYGGVTSDEATDFIIVEQQLHFAGALLSGDSTAYPHGFYSIPKDHALYGLGTFCPAYAISNLIDSWLGQKHTYDKSFSLVLHFISFVCGLGASWYVGRTVYLATNSHETSILAAVALLVTPVWIGYSVFNYKDIPVATGLIAIIYYAAVFVKKPNSKSAMLFFAALLFLGIQKIAALPLALPACVGVTVALMRHRSLRLAGIVTAVAVGFIICLVLLTPPSWQDPVMFLWRNLVYMSQHSWGRCTLTAGECIGRNFENGVGYSAIKYLGLWYAVQLPILLQLGLLAATVLYVRNFRDSKPITHLVAMSLAWPISAMAVRNSTLYDGIRHTLFLIPITISFVFMSIPAGFWLRWRLFLAAYGVLLLIDTMKLQPYGYVWFNEVARFVADGSNYETDHRMYSLREAARLGKALRKADEWLMGDPHHLVAPYVSKQYTKEIESIPRNASYVLIHHTRVNAGPPPGCKILARVERRQFLAPQPLELSFVARCRRL